MVNVNCHLNIGALCLTNLSSFSAENCFEMFSVRKNGIFQMTIHIDYDREENKIELILDSQSNVIKTLQEEYHQLSNKLHSIDVN